MTATDSNYGDIQDIMDKENVIMVYNGSFSQDIIKSILKYVENELAEQGVEELVKRRIFNVMVEMLQNIDKHQLDIGDESISPVFLLTAEEDSFGLITGNFIANDKIDIVQNKIDTVNALDADGLKALYKETRLNSRISDVGGAGLGFIDMARKTGNKMEYSFLDIENKDFKYFIFKTKLNSN